MYFAALAVIPGMLFMLWLYTRDVIHPEPKQAVYRLFLLGAAIVLPAGLLERGLLTTTHVHTRILVILMTAFFVAGMIEEFMKAAIVERSALQAGLMHSPMDCIVYAGATALGFATIENILYVTSSGFSTAILRSVTAVPAHLMFGIIMGTFFAKSLWFGYNRALAYVMPALAHGIYDTFALVNTLIGDVLLVIYLIVMIEWAMRTLSWAARTTLPQGLSQT